eukprot:5502967-Pleurochrysis_carterae.AAC.1
MQSFPFCICIACVLAERSCSAPRLPCPRAHGRRRLTAPSHRSRRAGAPAPRLRRSPRPCLSPPKEDVRGPDRAALHARSDRAIANGGTALNHLVELPGLGKSGGMIEWSKHTLVRPFWGTPEWAQANSSRVNSPTSWAATPLLVTGPPSRKARASNRLTLLDSTASDRL